MIFLNFQIKNLSCLMSLALLMTACSDKEADMIFDSNGEKQTTGKDIVFTKSANADWTKHENQDKITENVWLTRTDQGLLFNIKSETSSNGSGPTGTEWVVGSLDEYTKEQLLSLEFTSLKKAAESRMRNVVGKSFIVRLIEDDLFIDLTFLAWGNKSEGGGFSYSRSSVPTP